MFRTVRAGFTRRKERYPDDSIHSALYRRCNNPPGPARVTRPLNRAPEDQGSGDFAEEPRGDNWRRAAQDALDELNSTARIVWALLLHTTRSHFGRRDRTR